jgi:D-arabinose 1-dehydrogenase-like Zn-dependent alcohol dehydrogenase
MRQDNYDATYLLDSEAVMSTNIAKPAKVAIIGASGTYGEGILARAEEIGVKAVVVTRSPDKFKDVKPTTTVVEAQLNEEEKLKEALRAAMVSSPHLATIGRRVRRRTIFRTSGAP